MIRKILAFATVAAVAAAPTLVTSAAHAFPTRPMTLIVPYPPGGIVDPVARLVAMRLSEKLGQPIVVENKAGAGGALAAQQVKNGTADGHTLLLHSNAIAIHTALSRAPLYALADFTPIGMVASAPYLIITGGQSSVRSMVDLLALAKTNPKKVNYGTSGIGSSTHLATELLALQAGLEMTHIPYAGGGPTKVALVRNDIHFSFDTVAGSKSMLQGGQLRALAVTGPRRSSVFPDVPTVAESGVPSYNTAFWLSVFVSSKVSPEIVRQLGIALAEVLATQESKKALQALDLESATADRVQFQKALVSEAEAWSEVVTRANIRTN